MDFLGPKDVAAELGLHERSATRLMRDGTIQSCRVGPGAKLWRTTRAHLEVYLAEQFASERRRHAAPPTTPGLAIHPLRPKAVKPRVA